MKISSFHYNQTRYKMIRSQITLFLFLNSFIWRASFTEPVHLRPGSASLDLADYVEHTQFDIRHVLGSLYPLKRSSSPSAHTMKCEIFLATFSSLQGIMLVTTSSKNIICTLFQNLKVQMQVFKIFLRVYRRFDSKSLLDTPKITEQLMRTVAILVERD